MHPYDTEAAYLPTFPLIDATHLDPGFGSAAPPGAAWQTDVFDTYDLLPVIRHRLAATGIAPGANAQAMGGGMFKNPASVVQGAPAFFLYYWGEWDGVQRTGAANDFFFSFIVEGSNEDGQATGLALEWRVIAATNLAGDQEDVSATVLAGSWVPNHVFAQLYGKIPIYSRFLRLQFAASGNVTTARFSAALRVL